jgi:hypothetical protein
VKLKYKFLIGTLYLLKKRDLSPPKDKISLSTDDQGVSKTVVEYVVIFIICLLWMKQFRFVYISHAKQVLFDYHLNASQSSSFQEFHRMQNKSDCIFAKRARCWSAPYWLDNVSIEDNCER